VRVRVGEDVRVGEGLRVRVDEVLLFTLTLTHPPSKIITAYITIIL